MKHPPSFYVSPKDIFMSDYCIEFLVGKQRTRKCNGSNSGLYEAMCRLVTDTKNRKNAIFVIIISIAYVLCCAYTD
jgi:hypothetical protein